MSQPRPETDHIAQTRAAVLEAARNHVAFDGWSEACLSAAIADAGVDPGLARQAFPRGALDLAVAFHMAGDAELHETLAAQDLGAMRYSARVAHGIMERLRIAASDREAVRRGAAFFALPQNAGAGSKCVWNTADTIWKALGDTSDDINWYSKRVILSGVYSASLLYWLGDDSEGFERTRGFVDRRIDGVMRFEKMKAQMRKSPLWEAFRRGPGRVFDGVRAPGGTPPEDLPGYWGPGRR